MALLGSCRQVAILRRGSSLEEHLQPRPAGPSAGRRGGDGRRPEARAQAVGDRGHLEFWSAIGRQIVGLRCRRGSPRADFRHKKWSRERDSNPRPALYESAALPLSYPGSIQ